MEPLLRYRGRAVTRHDVHQIRELIATHPAQSRRALSQTLCTAWGWRQSNGAPRDMVCRGLMLALDRAGHIALPAVKRHPPNPLSVRARPQPADVDSSALSMSLRELGPLTFAQARRTPEEAYFNSLLQSYHYLGYTQPVGDQQADAAAVASTDSCRARIGCCTTLRLTRHRTPGPWGLARPVFAVPSD